MKRKLIGIFVCMLFLCSGVSFTISAVSTSTDKEQNGREYSSTGFDEPLEVRIEIEKLFDRVWLIKALALNTYDTTIQIVWTNKPVTFAVFYLVPDNDKVLMANSPLGRNNFIINRRFDFNPKEEKVILQGLFIGISNWILYGFKYDYPKYIESWPILPEGNYKVHASLNAYKINEHWVATYKMDELIFHYS